MKKLIESKGDHQIDSVFHEKKTGIDNHSLLKVCKEEQRVLVTLDTDFNNPIMHPLESLFGIIILRPSSQGKAAVNKLMANFLVSYKLEDCADKVILIEFDNIIIRWDCV